MKTSTQLLVATVLSASALVSTPAFAQETAPPAPDVETPQVETPVIEAPLVPDNPLSDVTPPLVPDQIVGEPPEGLGGPLFPDLPPVRSGEEVAPSGPAGSGLADARNNVAEDTPVLTLTNAIIMAIENNPQRDAALAALRAAQARIGIAKSAGGLQAGLSGSANYQRNFGGSTSSGGVVIPPGGTTGGGTNSGGSTGGGTTGGTTGGSTGFGISTGNNALTETLGVNASYPIYTGGRVKADRRAAEANARAQAAQTLQIEQTLVQNTIGNYLNVLRNAQLLDVAESNLSVSRERRRVAGLRYIAGAAARLEVLQANTQLADAQQRRITASNTLAQSKAALNTLLGRVPETPVRLAQVTALTPRVPLPEGVAGAVNVANTPETDSATLRKLAEEANPTLAANRAQVDAAIAQLAVAKAGKKPTVDLSLSGLLRNPVTFAGRFLLSLGLGVAKTLIDSGRTSSQVRAARAVLDQTGDNLNFQRLMVANQIESSLLTLDSADKRLNSADIAVEEAREQLRAAQIGYEAGVQTSLDVSDAQAALLQTQTEAANARFDVANEQANLSAAVGVLTVEGQTAYEQALQEEAAKAKTEATKIEAEKPKKKKKFLGIF